MRKLFLRNIDCSDCASRLEEAIRELDGVRTVSVNAATGVMYLDADDVEKVLNRVKRIEPGIEVGDRNASSRESSGSSNRKTAVVIVTSSVLFMIGMLYRDALHHTTHMYGEYLVFLPAYLLCGAGVLRKAAVNIRFGRVFDESFLMSIATLGALAIHQVPEAVGVMLFYRIGEFLQELSVDRSRSSIRSLLEVRPQYANLKRDGRIEVTSPEAVKPGDVIVVKAGEKIPLDGEILSGDSQLDTSTLTGEPVPRPVGPGDEVLSGMINVHGVLEVRVTRHFRDSSIARILYLVEEAGSKKAETEKFITKFARYYSPAVVFGAMGVALLPPLLLEGATFSEWIYRALVLLVISCPCALVISIPLGYFGGVGRASRGGILVKGANFLDVLSRVKTVVFDKTGTLTKGVFKVTEVVPENGFSEKDLLETAAEAESRSNHPIAQSIREAFGGETHAGEVESYEETAGRGVRAVISGRRIIAGSDKLLHEEGIEHRVCSVEGTVVHVALDGRYAGYIVIADEIREDALHVAEELRALGVERIVMLTGDEESVAGSVADKLGFDGFHADLLPEEKVEVMEKLMREHGDGDKVAFVGDGINDAPVIARADVGVAMGGLGSDAAIDTADVVIMTDAPSKLAEAIRVGRWTKKVVWENIILALIAKTVFIAAGLAGIATMWEAVFADVGVALIAVFNSTRILEGRKSRLGG